MRHAGTVSTLQELHRTSCWWWIYCTHSGLAEVVEVRLGLAHQEMTIGFMGSGSITIENLPIVETMTVHLYGSPGAFQITRQSRHTQLVVGSVIGASSLDHDRFCRWLWEVRPKRIGTHELTVKVSAQHAGWHKDHGAGL